MELWEERTGDTGARSPYRRIALSPPGLRLVADGHKVQGSAGCNRMMGSYELSGSSLKFGPLATTRMACPSMDAEQAYLGALSATTRYEIAGTTLTLFGPDGPVVRLELASAPAS